MRAVVQRVSQAEVRVENQVVGAIGVGYLVLVAFTSADGAEQLEYMAEKIINLRLFGDAEGKLNLALDDVNGELLIVSQFTLYGDVRKGRRPSYSDAAPAAVAEQLYEEFLMVLRRSGLTVAAGQFQAYMQVELVNDGPVTIIMDTAKLL